MRLSVLMTYYHNDKPDDLNSAFKSLFEQQVHCSEIVVVQDGDVTDTLQDIVIKWQKKLPIRIVLNKKNLGLGKSLNKGLKYCQEDLVARMDADDVCHPERFKKQLAFLEENPGISIVGSSVAEFENEITNIKTYRVLPEDPGVLRNYAKKRCPLNHPSVVFRKNDVLSVGGYGHYRNQQDYHLWVRMLQQGYKIANLKEPLLYMRVSEDLFSRRGGMKYFKMEYAIQKEFYEIGFLSRLEFIRNVSIRFVSRILPNKVRKVFYTRLLR